jgi:hypothetical protein
VRGCARGRRRQALGLTPRHENPIPKFMERESFLLIKLFGDYSMDIFRPKNPKQLAELRIRHAAGIAAALMVLRLIALLFRLLDKQSMQHLNVYWTIQCVIVLALCFGLFKQSRICAVLLTVYFICDVVSRFVMQEGVGLGLISTLVMAYVVFLCIRAIPATFRYHQILKQESIAESAGASNHCDPYKG